MDFAFKQRFFPLFVVTLCLATLLIASLCVIGQGFQPSDDALRHVAKVVSGKNWSDILLVRSEITMDSHPGWHAVLTGVQRLFAMEKDDLLVFSIIFLFLLFAFVPLFYFQRPEAWLMALLIMVLFSFGPLFRTFYGRPFIFSIFVTVLFCFLWKRIKDEKKPWIEVIGYAIAAALSTWIHGTWYLLSLPLAALFLARQWRVFWLMSSATAVGVAVGACLTGKPVAFLYQMVFHALEAFDSHLLQRQLVSEFQPFAGAPIVIVVVTLVLLWQRLKGEDISKSLDNPVFFLAGLGWVMGFVAVRFWSDWGWPAMTVWLALELQRILEQGVKPFTLKRLSIVVAACLVLFLALTNDRGSRWTRNLGVPWPKMAEADHRPWLPDEGAYCIMLIWAYFTMSSTTIHTDRGGICWALNPSGCQRTI
ncbi:MAG: hypothetical protein U5R49_03715 [Deltaproteobacteria bacterium]|nr:hypothetical protein [Deltaproteobacteria bacterium]